MRNRGFGTHLETRATPALEVEVASHSVSIAGPQEEVAQDRLCRASAHVTWWRRLLGITEVQGCPAMQRRPKEKCVAEARPGT